MPVESGARSRNFENLGFRQGRRAQAAREIPLVDVSHTHEVLLQARPSRAGQDSHTVFLPLAASQHDLAALYIDVLDAQLETLEEAESGPIQEPGDQPARPVQLRQQGTDLIAGQHDRQELGPLRVDDAVDAPERPAEHLAIEKQQGTEDLVLRGRAHVFLNGKVRHEGGDFGGTHLRRMAYLVEQNVPATPAHVCLFGAWTAVARPQGDADTIEELRARGSCTRVAHRDGTSSRKEIISQQVPKACHCPAVSPHQAGATFGRSVGMHVEVSVMEERWRASSCFNHSHSSS